MLNQLDSCNVRPILPLLCIPCHAWCNQMYISWRHFYLSSASWTAFLLKDYRWYISTQILIWKNLLLVHLPVGIMKMNLELHLSRTQITRFLRIWTPAILLCIMASSSQPWSDSHASMHLIIFIIIILLSYQAYIKACLECSKCRCSTSYLQIAGNSSRTNTGILPIFAPCISSKYRCQNGVTL